MKKLGKILGWVAIIIILFFVVVLFIGGEDDTTNDESQENTETVIFENDDFKVTYTGVEEALGMSGCCLVDLTIENNTDGTVSAYLQNSSYNGEMANVVTGVTNSITAGSKSTKPYTMLFNSEDMDIDDLESLSFQIMFLDDNANDLLTTDLINIDFK